jgi:hypothetical protein
MNKKAWVLLGGYILLGVFTFYANNSKEFRSGPCTPNLDVLSFLLSGLISTILFTISIARLFLKRKNQAVLIINFIAVAGWWAYLIIDSLHLH